MFVLRGLTLIALSSLTVCYPGASVYRNIRRLSGSPDIYARQEEEQPKNNDPEAWCETIDVMADEANALKVWEGESACSASRQHLLTYLRQRQRCWVLDDILPPEQHRTQR